MAGNVAGGLILGVVSGGAGYAGTAAKVLGYAGDAYQAGKAASTGDWQSLAVQAAAQGAGYYASKTSAGQATSTKPDLVYRAPRPNAHVPGSNPYAATTPGEHLIGRDSGVDFLTDSPFESWTANRAVAEEFAKRRGTQVLVQDLRSIDPVRIAADLRTKAGREAAAASESNPLAKKLFECNQDSEVIVRKR